MPNKRLYERGLTRQEKKASSRAYPGYEDDSPGGRAAIKAFNAAGGANYLNRNDSKSKYDKAVKASEVARKTQGKRGAGLGG